ncbi:alpha/beta hydrolase [Nocardia transvalensis]|uniref:alpha/beta hydrolase n=1 Tax=Nocardia transvalensis TaxID=37333 RepID=UPI00189488EB|nr:alpha/beta hydrolase [Nocardia transvalensis]MBF6328128.1 alpha/beta hydrolase [Nocardia transvalensis]
MKPLVDDLIPLSADAPSPLRDPAPYGQVTVIPEIGQHRDLRVLRNVTQPALSVHRPDPFRATGTAMIVCPGGSYMTLVDATELTDRLVDRGITVFVLRYRLLPTPVLDEDFVGKWAALHTMDEIKAHAPVAAPDARRAVRVVRERADEFGIDPHRIGILGFSGGGQLALAAATGYDSASRPDFAAPVYPPVWLDYRVPADAPPLFLCFAADDEGENLVADNLALHRSWLAAGRPVEMHVYERGRHGFAEAEPDLPCRTWLDRLLDWMRSHGF